MFVNDQPTSSVASKILIALFVRILQALVESLAKSATTPGQRAAIETLRTSVTLILARLERDGAAGGPIPKADPQTAPQAASSIATTRPGAIVASDASAPPRGGTPTIIRTHGQRFRPPPKRKLARLPRQIGTIYSLRYRIN